MVIGYLPILETVANVFVGKGISHIISQTSELFLQHECSQKSNL